MNKYWIFYAAGVLLPFVLKAGHHLWNQDKQVAGFWKALGNFVFADVTTSLKTVTNLAAEWVIGAILVDRLPVPFTEPFDMPEHVALAFFAGVIAESILVPPLLNLLTKKFAPA
jgi:hypothetical protein